MELYFIFSIFCILCDFFATVVGDHDIFSAVTSFPKLGELYLQAKISRTKEPHFESDTTLSAETKKDICRSITTSGYSALQGLKSVDIDTIYEELRSFVKEYPHVAAYHKEVMQDYQQVTPSETSFTYSSRSRFFNIGPRQREPEISFACVAVERSTNEFVIFYISEAYNINAVLDVPTEGPIFARFICRAMYVICDLVAIAEEPALAITSPTYPVEDAYLQYRKLKKNKEATKSIEDPLCQCSKSEKLRICASVAGSFHFADRIKFIPDEANVSEQCKLLTVSFRTSEAVERTKNDPWYNEWMLSCSVQAFNPSEAPGNSTIFISRAYTSQYVFVYTLDRSTNAFYIENISARISPMIERETLIRDANEVVSPMDLSQTSTETTEVSRGVVGKDLLIKPDRIQREISVYA